MTDHEIIHVVINCGNSYLMNTIYDFDNSPTYIWTEDPRRAFAYFDYPCAADKRKEIISCKKRGIADSNFDMGRITLGKLKVELV